MGNVAAVLGVVLLMIGVVLVALFGNTRSTTWGPALGMALVVLGLGVEVVGAVAVAA
jgi:MFS superfamily sulfate permease-like transporter